MWAYLHSVLVDKIAHCDIKLDNMIRRIDPATGKITIAFADFGKTKKLVGKIRKFVLFRLSLFSQAEAWIRNSEMVVENEIFLDEAKKNDVLLDIRNLAEALFNIIYLERSRTDRKE